MMFELEKPTKDPIKYNPITAMLANRPVKNPGLEELDYR
jgi:hypothetical protein